MIPFEEMDDRLRALGIKRAWLATKTPYTADYIRTVLAPNSTRRTERVQEILSDAIEREETQRASCTTLPDRFSLEVSPEVFENYSQIALGEKMTLKEWSIKTLNEAADAAMLATSEESNIIDGPFHIDLIGGVAAGAPIALDHHAQSIPVTKEFPPDHYALRVFGESMEPKIPDGSVIVVKRLPDGTAPKKKSIVVYSDGEGSTLKQLAYRDAESDEEGNSMGRVPVLKSLNKAFANATTMECGRIEAVYVETL